MNVVWTLAYAMIIWHVSHERWEAFAQTKNILYVKLTRLHEFYRSITGLGAEIDAVAAAKENAIYRKYFHLNTKFVNFKSLAKLITFIFRLQFTLSSQNCT